MPIGLHDDYCVITLNGQVEITAGNGKFNAIIPTAVPPPPPIPKLEIITYFSNRLLNALKKFQDTEYVTITDEGIEGATLVMDYPPKVTAHGDTEFKVKTDDFINLLDIDDQFIKLSYMKGEVTLYTNRDVKTIPTE